MGLDGVSLTVQAPKPSFNDSDDVPTLEELQNRLAMVSRRVNGTARLEPAQAEGGPFLHRVEFERDRDQGEF